MNPGVSIAVAAFDRPRLLRATLDSLAALKVPPSLQAEILVIASPVMKEAHVIVDEIKSRCSIPIRLLTELKPGLSNARNQALQEAAFEYVAYFDDDVQVAPDWLGGFLEAMVTHSPDCVVGPVTPIYEAPVPDYLQSDHALSHITSPHTRKGPSMLVLPPEQGHEVPGCNFTVRKQVALNLGGFNPDFGSCGTTIVGEEDVEFGRQLVRAGKKVVYQPRCAVGHVISTQKLSKQWFRPREYGGGISRGMAAAERGYPLQGIRKVRFLLGMLRRMVLMAFFEMRGKRAQAFEQEIRLREAFGFLRGYKQKSR